MNSSLALISLANSFKVRWPNAGMASKRLSSRAIRTVTLRYGRAFSSMNRC